MSDQHAVTGTPGAINPSRVQPTEPEAELAHEQLVDTVVDDDDDTTDTETDTEEDIAP